MEKEWLQFDRRTSDYKKGARNFVNEARAREGSDVIICPCITCRNFLSQHFETAYEHLVIKGMYSQYDNWFCHGESGSEPVHNEEVDISETYKMYKDCYLQHDEVIGDALESKDSEFANLVREAETPLFFGCTKYTKMSASVALLKMKARHCLTNVAFNDILEAVGGMLPEDNTLPDSLYSTKKLVKPFDLGYEKIHACANDCCLFRKNLQHAEECPKCGTSRWKRNESSSEIQKGIPAKVLRYFPIIPRLKRMFGVTEMAEQLRWHSNHKSQDGKMRHPVDGLAWETIDRKWPSFASEPRNIRFGLATDGFNPFQDLSSRYSCWPVILTTYNLPPWLCMSKESMMLTLLIPGPKQPGNDIDVFLAPLIDDLKELWNYGVEVYDAFSKMTFNLKAVLMWTINDFPAYGNLSGWPYKGRFACPICREDTCSHWLTNSHKFTYMGHRRFLPLDHPFRKQASLFNGHPENGSRPKISKGEDIFKEVDEIVNDFGKKSKNKEKNMTENESTKNRKNGGNELNKKRKRGEKKQIKKKRNKKSRKEMDQTPDYVWKKKSIFFELPYWKSVLVRHNLDVMHIEKNICDSIVGTLLNLKGKSKDGLKSRKDLEEMHIRKDLHPTVRGKKFYIRAGPHTLSKREKRIFCWRLANIKLPDGYGSNIGKCISLEDFKIYGLKSHDCHILMQQLLPVALRGCLPKGPRVAIFRLCAFFSELCQKVLDRNKLEKMEEEVVETLCMLEKYFPPSFFDIMVHLTIHLGREARLCGPVQYRWMYPFERYMKVLKGYVMNRAHPEGCIAERYLAEECSLLCSKYIKQVADIGRKHERNEEFDTGLLQQGNTLSRGKKITLSPEMLHAAHHYVLINSDEVRPYRQLHLDELERSDKRLSKNETLLHKKHRESFAQWLEKKIMDESMVHDVSTTLEWLAGGPSAISLSYSGFIINGIRYHTMEADKSRQSSGISLEADTLCRSSAKDNSMMDSSISYYGVLRDVIVLSYHAFHIALFKCDWVNIINGVKFDDGLTLVNLHEGQSQCKRDPFILASQAKQVFYSREDETSSWYVVLQAPPRGFNELERDNDTEYGSFTPFDASRLDYNNDDDEQYARNGVDGMLCDA